MTEVESILTALPTGRCRTLVGGLVAAGLGPAAVLVGVLAGTVRGLYFGLLGALCVLIGVMIVRQERRPFRFGIGPQGLTLRMPGIDRLGPWTAIEALVLDQLLAKLHDRSTRSGPFLVLLPAEGSDLLDGRPERTLPDGRTGRLILELDEVRQPREQIAEALRLHGGGRFTDALRERQSWISGHEFTTVPRGYDTAAVERLVRRAADAVGSGEYLPRIWARAAIDNASLPVVDGGYDCRQVEEALRAIATQLAELLPAEETH